MKGQVKVKGGFLSLDTAETSSCKSGEDLFEELL